MPHLTLTIKDVDEAVIASLTKRAAESGRTLHEELHHILNRAAHAGRGHYVPADEPAPVIPPEFEHAIATDLLREPSADR